MNVLLLGAGGYFGSNITTSKLCLEKYTHDEWPIEVAIENPDMLKTYDCIINCAAMVNQDRAENDPSYRADMINVNASLAIKLGMAYKGHMVHISTPFIYYDTMNEYTRTKKIANDFFIQRKNTAIVIPGHPYGGFSPNNFHKTLLNNIATEMVLDNVSEFNIIDLSLFSAAIIDIILESKTGTFNVFEKGRFNKYTLAKHILKRLPECWKEGEYVPSENEAKRPKKWTIDDQEWNKWQGVKNIVC